MVEDSLDASFIHSLQILDNIQVKVKFNLALKSKSKGAPSSTDIPMSS